MRIVLQRVKEGKVIIDNRPVSAIGQGYLIFAGIGQDDQVQDAEFLAKKIVNLRVFADAQGKMNLNIKQVLGEILSVSQFTLYADTDNGNRPGFEAAARPELALNLWRQFNDFLRQGEINVQEGVFAADMQVELVNDGPVTIILDSKKNNNF